MLPTRSSTSATLEAVPLTSTSEAMQSPSPSHSTSPTMEQSVAPMEAPNLAPPSVAPATQITFGVGKRRKKEKIKALDPSTYGRKGQCIQVRAHPN
jgi:hypothetical protein